MSHAAIARIWSLLDGSRTADEIVDLLCAEYEVEAATARGDLEALLDDLAGVSLISKMP